MKTPTGPRQVRLKKLLKTELPNTKSKEQNGVTGVCQVFTRRLPPVHRRLLLIRLLPLRLPAHQVRQAALLFKAAARHQVLRLQVPVLAMIHRHHRQPILNRQPILIRIVHNNYSNKIENKKTDVRIRFFVCKIINSFLHRFFLKVS